MPTLPDSVEHAFNAIRVINTEEWLQEDIEAFQERWGGVDLLTFARVLQQAQGDDQMVAAFAIGHTRSAWARGLLLPFLQSDDPGVRWAAALSLGEMKDERARPVLVRMLGSSSRRRIRRWVKWALTGLKCGTCMWLICWAGGETRC